MNAAGEVPTLTPYAVDCLIDGPDVGHQCPVGCGRATVGQRDATITERRRSLTGFGIVKFLRCERCSRRWEGRPR